MDKAALRVHFKDVRMAAARADRMAPQTLARRIDLAHYRAGCIGGYHAIGGEMDPSALLVRLERAGAVIALVRMDTSDLMQFRIAGSSGLERGPFGIMQPRATDPVVQPDIILMPLIACDSSGVRLGRGGGHYDRFLARAEEEGHRPLRIGLAFDDQITHRLPRDAHDQMLHRIETPTRSIKCNSGSYK